MLSPQITVYTAGANGGDLQQSWQSLLDQSYTGWEWVVLLDGPYWRPLPDDSRVRIVLDDAASHPPAAKSLARSVALGAVLVELDGGDRLAPDALSGRAEEAGRARPRGSAR